MSKRDAEKMSKRDAEKMAKRDAEKMAREMNAMFMDDSDGDMGSESDSENEDEVVKITIKNTRRKKSKKQVSTYSRTHDHFIQMTEKFDADKLSYICDNFKEFKEQMRWKDHYDITEPEKQIRKYLARSRNGGIRVDYLQKSGRGRHFAVGSLSLQNIPREIRQTICNEFYDDIDMSNAHPVILLHLAKEHGFTCDKLEEYVLGREKILKQIIINRKVASREQSKKIYLSLTNGGKKDYNLIKTPSEHAKAYKIEMKRLHENFADKDPKAYEKVKASRIAAGKNYNHKASYMNHLLCDMENKILMAMVEFFEIGERGVLCFDGLMVEKGGDYNIEGCMAHIKEVIGIDMGLKIKPMDEKFDLSGIKLPKHEYFSLDYFNDFDNMLENAIEYEADDGEITKYIYPEWAEEWLKNSVSLLKRSGEQCFITLDQKVDFKTKEIRKYHTHVKSKEFFDTLRVNCNILNPKYSKVIAQDKTKKGHPRGDFFMFTRLGPKAPMTRDTGFVEHCVVNRKMQIYNNITFYPYLRRKGIPVLADLNTFTGFPLEDIAMPEEKDRIVFENSKFYKHLKEEFFNNDAGELKHFLDHIADMVQCPNENRGNAHLFYSPQGCGKGMFAKFMGKLLGVQSCITIKDFNRYMQKFNMLYSDKLLKIFEELPEKGGAFKQSDKLKGQIDQTEENVEPKGFKAYTVPTYSKFTFFTNNRNTLYIEGSCRRYTLHAISGKYANDHTYFEPIWAEIRNPDFMRCAFEYMAERKYDVRNTMVVYDTKYKQEQKQSNLPKGVKFMKEWIEGKFDEVKDEEIKISSADLCSKYREFCEDGYGNYHKGAFLTQLMAIDIEKPKQLRIEGVKTVCFKINTKRILDSFRDFTKTPTFNFDFGE